MRLVDTLDPRGVGGDSGLVDHCKDEGVDGGLPSR